MQFDQSSPVQPVAELGGGTLSVTEKDGGRRTEQEILVSNIGFFKIYLFLKFSYLQKVSGQFSVKYKVKMDPGVEVQVIISIKKNRSV